MDIYWRKTIFTALAAVSLIFAIGFPIGIYINFQRAMAAASADNAFDGGMAAAVLAPTIYMQMLLIVAIGGVLAAAFFYGASRCAAVIRQMETAGAE